EGHGRAAGRRPPGQRGGTTGLPGDGRRPDPLHDPLIRARPTFAGFDHRKRRSRRDHRRRRGHTSAMSLPIQGFSHVRVTVTDMARSRRFYDNVLGLPVAFEMPADADDAIREQMWWLFDGVVYQVPGGFFGLRPVAPGGDRFDENRAGLDHVAFKVPSRADLDAAAAKLDGLGVAHDGVKDIGLGCLLEFRDPDNIALELWADAS